MFHFPFVICSARMLQAIQVNQETYHAGSSMLFRGALQIAEMLEESESGRLVNV